jgi:UDP-N-acetylglucosamine 4,6-dehydratase/5-epimerase
MSSLLKGKNILVTGGSGSIGKEIVRKSLSDGASLVRVFSNDENGLYETELELSGKNIEYVIGDIRNPDTVNSIVKDIDIVFHTSALKHVDRCELNPYEAVTVNTIGAYNICKSSMRESVSKVINISTDKAVNPIGVLGATKLLSEKLISAESFHNKSKTIFSSVRFGNVLQTRGSIIPRIENQIKQGGPITLTDKKMKRFFMTKNQSVELILKAAEYAKGGETFVLKMPLILLDDLFDVMKEVIAPTYNLNPSKIKTKIIGIRPGEKITEYLLTDFELENVLETNDFFIIPSMFNSSTPKKYRNAKKPKNIKNYFESLKPITKSEIKNMLKHVY